MINNVALVGRLTRDADLRYTGNDTPVANFTIAAERPFTNSQGERDADFINCVIWRKDAENLANLSKKGSLIGITGRIQTRSYENNQGQTVYVTEVVAENFQMLEPKSVTDERRKQTPQTNMNQAGGYKSGMSQPRRSNPAASDTFNEPFAQSGDKVEISESDLPF